MKKKAFNLLLAAALTAAISVPTLADDNTGAEASPSITISRDATYDGTTQRTYGAYKIFTATYIANSGSNSAENKDSFSYTTEGAGVAYQMDVNSPWKNAMLAESQTWRPCSRCDDYRRRRRSIRRRQGLLPAGCQ